MTNAKHNPMHQAISFLARRDHSVHELRTKLLLKEHGVEDVEKVLQELQALDYLDDRRYTQMMLRHHHAKGQGPQKIRYLLHQNGVANDIVSDAFTEFEGDWYELAFDVRKRRFGEHYISNEKSQRFKEKAKQTRFLMSRGFEADQIQYAFNSLDA